MPLNITALTSCQEEIVVPILSDDQAKAREIGRKFISASQHAELVLVAGELEIRSVLDVKGHLLRLSFDQLRTLVMVSEMGSPRKAAQALGREQSSVVSQLRSLNTYFQDLCGEALTVKRDRGEDYVVTETGKTVVDLSRALLETWNQELERRRSQVARRLVIGTTLFTLPILARVWPAVVETLSQSVDLRVEQVRTAEFWQRLASRELDLVIGGRVTDGDLRARKDFDFREWARDGIALITNLAPKEIANSVAKDELVRRRWPVILPQGGIIVDYVKEVCGQDYQRTLAVTPPISDVFYGIDMLRLGIVHGVMFATSTVAEMAAKNAFPAIRIERDAPPALTLRVIALGDGFRNLEVVTGLFGRKGERKAYEQADPHHPLAAFWRLFESHSPANHG